MITLTLIAIIGIVFFVLGAAFKLLFGLLGVLLWPVKAVLGVVGAIVAISLIVVFGAVFFVPIILFVVGWLICKAVATAV